MAASRAVLVKLIADATGAKAGLRETAAEVKKFGAYTAEATVKIQTEGVQAKLDKLNAQLKRYGEQPHTADVQIRMGNVARQIERTELQLKALTDRPHEVKVGVNERSFLRVRERIGKLSFGDTIGRAGGAAFAAAGLGAGVFEAVKSVTEAYNQEQGAQARLQTQLGALNISYADNAKQIEEVIQRTSALSGLTGHDLNDAFTNIVRSTGNVSRSLNLVGLAADIARAKNLDVARAGQLVGKVAAGSVSALTRYGIVIKKGATATEALGILQHKFGGQAAAYGKTQQGALDRVNVAFEHLREVIGAKLAPTLTRAANGLARFVRQMAEGTGAGGRFVRQLRNIASRIGAVVGFLLRHKTAIAVAIGAWAAYRLAAVAAIAITRLRLVGMFFGLGPRAAVGGAEAGAAYGEAFSAAAGSRFAAFAARWAPFLGPAAAVLGPALAIYGLGKAANAYAGQPDTPNSFNRAMLGPQPGDVRLPHGPANPQAGNRGQGQHSTMGLGVYIHDRPSSHGDAGGDPTGRFPTHRPTRPTRKTLAQILAGLGSASQVTSANLQLGLRQAEQAYAKAVRQHGGSSPAAIQAAQAVISARQAIADANKPSSSTSAAARRRRQAAAGSGPATPAERADLNAAQRYAAIVRKYGAGSDQAKVAKDRENLAGVRAAIQAGRDRLSLDIRKFGASSEKAIRDRLTLSKLQVRLVETGKALTGAIQKNTAAQHAALLPRLTDVAYHPVSGRMQHAPRQHGVGAGGVVNHWGGIHNNISTPGGMQYPDPEAFAAALQRKLAAKGNA